MNLADDFLTAFKRVVYRGGISLIDDFAPVGVGTTERVQSTGKHHPLATLHVELHVFLKQAPMIDISVGVGFDHSSILVFSPYTDMLYTVQGND